MIPATTLNDDVILKIYDYVPMTTPINKHIRVVVNSTRNNAARCIQRMLRTNQIFSEMPILFTSDLNAGTIPKWLLIRIYMKFYPSIVLFGIPIRILENNYTHEFILSHHTYRSLWFKFNRSYDSLLDHGIRKYDVFLALQMLTFDDIVTSSE